MSGPRRHTQWLTATCRSHQGPISHQWVIDTHESLSELVSSHIILPELSRPCQVWLAHISTWQCPLWTGWRAGRSGGWRCWPEDPGPRPWSSVKTRQGRAESRGQPPWWWSAGEAALGPLCPRHSWSVSPSLIWMCWQLWSPLRALTWHLSTCHHMCQCTQSLILAGTQAWQAQENLGSCYSHVNFTFTLLAPSPASSQTLAHSALAWAQSLVRESLGSGEARLVTAVSPVTLGPQRISRSRHL